MHDKKFVQLMIADTPGLTITDKAEFIRMIVYPAIHEALPVLNHPEKAEDNDTMLNFGLRTT